MSQSLAIVSALALNQEAFVEVMTRDVWQLEQRATGGDGQRRAG
jgi:hypothetical protein